MKETDALGGICLSEPSHDLGLVKLGQILFWD